MPISNVYNMDCMLGMQGFTDNYFDLAIVDPPYGINERASRNNTGDRPTKKWASPKSVKYDMFDDSSAPNKEYFTELFRVSKNQIVWGGNYFSSYLPVSMGWIVWDKKVDEKEHLSMVEMAWSSFQRRASKYELLWAGFKKGEQTERIHPTQKPIALYNWLLKNYATPGQRIIDTHLGSQSSRIAAYKLGFDFWGYELDADYFKEGCQRYEKAISQPLFDAPRTLTQSSLL